MYETILNCPFCGSTAEVQSMQRKYEYVPTVECTGCGANVPPRVEDMALTVEIGPEDAIRAWNLRVPS